jgi:hypothetical protein
MATLALSSIGSALGGPIGGAIGSLIGQTIDKSLFGPGPRHGPRLNDLSVQTSSYGTQIPRIYGAMRVAGSVIWATELKESCEPQSGGKGQPDTIVYGYSASFAVVLSSRPASGVGRIWADGKLLRGAAGDFKMKTGFRFYPGDDDQPIDPLIASVEGIDRTPAFRGLALAVFEDLQLAVREQNSVSYFRSTWGCCRSDDRSDPCRCERGLDPERRSGKRSRICGFRNEPDCRRAADRRKIRGSLVRRWVAFEDACRGHESTRCR